MRAAAARETIWGASAEQQKPLSGQNKPNLNQHHRWAQTYAREIIENNNVKKKKKKRDCFLRRLRCVSCDGGSTLLPTCSFEGKERGEGFQTTTESHSSLVQHGISLSLSKSSFGANFCQILSKHCGGGDSFCINDQTGRPQFGPPLV